MAVDLLNMLRFYHLASGARARRLGRAVRRVLGPPRGDARAAAARRRTGRQRPPRRFASAARSRRCSPRPPGASASSRSTPRAPPTCATCTSAATSTCASTSGATTACSASSPITVCAPSSSPTASSSSCCSSADPGRRAASQAPGEGGDAQTMRYVVRRLLAAVRAEHPWAFWHDLRDVERESRRLVAPYPFGETIPDGRRRPAHLAHAAGRRGGRRGAARVRAGLDRRSAASPRGRPPGPVRLQRRRPHRRSANRRVRLAAARPPGAAPRRPTSGAPRQSLKITPSGVGVMVSAVSGLRRNRPGWRIRDRTIAATPGPRSRPPARVVRRGVLHSARPSPRSSPGPRRAVPS